MITTAVCIKAIVDRFNSIKHSGDFKVTTIKDWKRVSKKTISGEICERIFKHRNESLNIRVEVVADSTAIWSITTLERSTNIHMLDENDDGVRIHCKDHPECSGKILFMIEEHNLEEYDERNGLVFSCGPQEADSDCFNEEESNYHALDELFFDVKGFESGIAESMHSYPYVKGKTAKQLWKEIRKILLDAGAVEIKENDEDE